MRVAVDEFALSLNGVAGDVLAGQIEGLKERDDHRGCESIL